MGAYTVTPIFKGGWLIWEKAEEVCMYLVCGNKRAAMIDAGMGTGNLLSEVSALTDLPVLPLLTHGHPDHYLGVMSCPFVYLNEKDHALMRHYIELDAREAGTKAPPVPEIRPLQAQFDLGGLTLRTVSLRGHTQGSAGFLLEEEKVLFSGDGLIYNVWMQMEESTSLEEYRTTLKNLQVFRPCFERIWTGHGTVALDAGHLDRVTNLLDAVIEAPFGVPTPPDQPPGIIADGEACQITYRLDNIETETRRKEASYEY